MEPNLSVTMAVVACTSTPQTVATPHSDRRYLACYAKTGTSYISYGDSHHNATAIQMLEGEYRTIPSCSKVVATGDNSFLVIIHHEDESHPHPVEEGLYYNGVPLTYNGSPLLY